MKNTFLMAFTWIVILSTLLPGLNHGIWRPDEPQVAGISSEVARTGDFVVPRLNGTPFLEKPPLYYDAAAISALVFGTESDVSYRLVSVMFGLLTILIVFAMVRRRSGTHAGLAAAGILASTWGFFMSARWIQVDSALVFFTTLAVYLYMKVREKPSLPVSMLLGLALGLSFMSKGLVGPAIFISALFMDIIVKRDPGLVWRINPITAGVFACLPVLPWVAGLYSQGGWPFLRETLIVNNFMRFLGSPEGAALGHQHGPLYYLTNLPSDVLPWTLIMIPALVTSIRNYRKDPYLSWFVAPFILLSLSSTKRSVYLVPLFPALACIAAQWLMNGAERRPWERIMTGATWVIALVGCLAPFAGILLHLPVLSIAMGLLSLSVLAVLRHRGIFETLRPLSLVLIVCIGMTVTMSVYFSAMKPREDYLGIAREMLALSQDRQISIYLGENEILDGVLPMVKGGTCPMKKAGDDLPAGLYAWVETREAPVAGDISREGNVKVLIQRRIGNKNAVLAEFVPLRASSSPGRQTPEGVRP